MIALTSCPAPGACPIRSLMGWTAARRDNFARDLQERLGILAILAFVCRPVSDRIHAGHRKRLVALSNGLAYRLPLIRAITPTLSCRAMNTKRVGRHG
jgi:hypothetical protein